MKIAFQGAHGAYSDMACRAVYPQSETVPCLHFAQTLEAVHKGHTDLAMVPIDNLIAGRVADIHRLLPHSGLHIIGEYYQPIDHCLLAVAEADLTTIKTVHSHIHALPQCTHVIKELGLEPVIAPDTAMAAQQVAREKDIHKSAIASKLAAEIYGLKILRENIQDYVANVTRFLIMSPKPIPLSRDDRDPIVTSLIFKVRSIPAALYKALGGFATNNVNLTKLESYLVDGAMQAAQFYCEVDGHPENENMRFALAELQFFATDIQIMGTYKADPFRKNQK